MTSLWGERKRLAYVHIQNVKKIPVFCEGCIARYGFADRAWACNKGLLCKFWGFKLVFLCCFALQILPQQTWISWNFPSCVTVCAGTYRIFPSPSSPPQYILKWSTPSKVRADDAQLFKNRGADVMQRYWTFGALNGKTTAPFSVASTDKVFLHDTLFCTSTFSCCHKARNRISVVNRS